MPDEAASGLIARKYLDVFGVALTPCFAAFISCGDSAAPGATLGYRCADAGPLFLERYLDAPIEAVVSSCFGHRFERARIVEIGNFAAGNAMTMVELWGAAANDLAGRSEVAVATLTAPLRRMFARIGLPIRVLAPASRARAGNDPERWGSYYEHDPQVCAGLIAQGQDALASFVARRGRRACA